MENYWYLGFFFKIFFFYVDHFLRSFSIDSDSKESACNAGDQGSNSGLGRRPGGGNGNPLQYSCLENRMDREAWQAIVHGVTRVGHNLATKPPPPPNLNARATAFST